MPADIKIDNSFQAIVEKLQSYWASHGCLLIQPYGSELGAGTLHPATTLRSLSHNPWKVAYVQPSIRPADGRYGENPNRLYQHHQFQVILKPSPDNIQTLYLDSLRAIGIDPLAHDIRFVEDDWENPSIGAWGLGWEVWCDGMEITQFTYMQQIGGIDCRPIPGELTYGLERLIMYIQNVENVYDLAYNSEGVTYGDVFHENEREFSAYALDHANPEQLRHQFEEAKQACDALIERELPLVAYDQCVKASHLLNLLDARGVLGVAERANFIAQVRTLAKSCCEAWVQKCTPQQQAS